MMMKSVYCSVAVLCMVLSLANSAPLKPVVYDHFVFVQQYPAGVCQFHDATGSGYKCHYPRNSTAWTIHGLWPTYRKTKGPICCDKSARFSLDDVESLVPKLVSEWTNLKNCTTFDFFWKHEFLNHGTCSGMNQLDFFSKVLSLFESMQFGSILSSNGIDPSHSPKYYVDDFTEAFMKKFNVTPLVKCQNTKSAGQFLKQIELCLDKSFKPIECPSSSSTCMEGVKVVYPPSVYHS